MFVHALSRLRYVDSPILRDSFSGGTLVPADRLYYLTDANHNVTAVMDIDGDVQERYDYDAYGRFTIYDPNWANPGTTSAVDNTLLFAGQDVEPQTGLQYSRARWYNSTVGAFISRDPIGFAAGDMNLYRYVGSNPISYVDPDGMEEVLAVWVESGVIGEGGLGFHKSISFGDPNGAYRSVSFGIRTYRDYFKSGQGYIYIDEKHGGWIDPQRYRTITRDEFDSLTKVFEAAVKAGKPYHYGPRQNCTNFSDEMWDAITKKNVGTPAKPP
jgi:RHS repeat-associated protein